MLSAGNGATVRGGAEGLAERAWVLWISAGGCDGCTMAVLGATSPRIEELLSGHLTHIPRIDLVHPALAFDAGTRYISALQRAATGELDPFILVVEGALFDQTLAGTGSFSRLGGETVERWVGRLAPRAMAVVAIGTCATWGGIPAAAGSVTGAMGLHEFLGDDFKAKSGLPIVNLPGCAPNGDTFVETVSYVLLHLGGLVPLELDDQGRPRWLYLESTPLQATGGAPSASETADCPVPTNGWINHLGGCASVGGRCIGCTRPDFPDRVLPLVVSG